MKLIFFLKTKLYPNWFYKEQHNNKKSLSDYSHVNQQAPFEHRISIVIRFNVHSGVHLLGLVELIIVQFMDNSDLKWNQFINLFE